MSDISIKELLQTMSLDGIEDVVDIIRSRSDIVSVVLLTETDLLEMKAEDERHFRQFAKQIQKDIADAPA
jgi:Cu2+-containing amine oxidase